MIDLRQRWQTLLELGRVSNLPTVWSNITAAAFLSGGASGALPVWGFLLAGGTLLYLAGTTLNDFFDAAFDRRHRPERPIPRGIWSKMAVGWLGAIELLLGAGSLMLAGSHGIWVGSLVAAILIYNAIHKRWTGSVIFMGACRGCLALAVISAFSARIGTLAWLYVISLVLYIIGITLTARAESGPERLRHWPRLLFLMPVAALLAALPGLSPPGGAAPWALALVAYGILLERAWRRLITRPHPARIGACVSLLLAGIVLLDALFVSVVAGWPWLGLLLLFVAALAWQGRVAAT